MAARSVYEYVVTALSQTRGEAAPPEADPAGDSQPQIPVPLREDRLPSDVRASLTKGPGAQALAGLS